MSKVKKVNVGEFVPFSEFDKYNLKNMLKNTSVFKNTPTEVGIDRAIEILSTTIDTAMEEQRYSVNLANYVPVLPNVGQTNEKIFAYSGFGYSNDPWSGLVETDYPTSYDKTDAGVETVSTETQMWIKEAKWSALELARASRDNAWDPVRIKIDELFNDWNHVLEANAFTTTPGRANMRGLLTVESAHTEAPGAATNPIKGNLGTETTSANIDGLAGRLINAYKSRSKNRVEPDTLIMPTSHYIAAQSKVSPISNDNRTILEVLRAQFGATNDPNAIGSTGGFRIIPLDYVEAGNPINPQSNNRYVLYRNNRDTIVYPIPQTFRMTSVISSDGGLFFRQLASGMIAGLLVGRPENVQYFDVAA